MSADTNSRDATATIQGYLYQFDATILAILQLQESASILIEGIEDFDIYSKDIAELFQCKYYAATKLTPATIRDAILPMLQGFMGLSAKAREARRFHLYGYFKDSTPGDKTLSVDDLKKSLIRREHSAQQDGASCMEVIDLQKVLGASDQDITDFAKLLTIHICEDYLTHKTKVIEALRAFCKVSLYEAEAFLYPSARTIVSGLAATQDSAARRISKAQFVAQITPSRALYNAWFFREKGEREYCLGLRRDYFSERNIDAANRFFVVDATAALHETEVLSFCHALRNKWSSHHVKRKPNAERYAPFVYIRDFSSPRLIDLKIALYADGVTFVDGYAFNGAPFDIEHLCATQTYENQISLRIITSLDDFALCLKAIKRRRFVFDFFKEKPLSDIDKCTHISIPIASVAMIHNII